MTTAGCGSALEATGCPREAQGHENKKHFYNSTSLRTHLDLETHLDLSGTVQMTALLFLPHMLSGKLLNLHALCFLNCTVRVFVRHGRLELSTSHAQGDQQ